jgi:transcriptional regulator with XRE-family HTH domain
MTDEKIMRKLSIRVLDGVKLKRGAAARLSDALGISANTIRNWFRPVNGGNAWHPSKKTFAKLAKIVQSDFDFSPMKTGPKKCRSKKV